MHASRSLRGTSLALPGCCLSRTQRLTSGHGKRPKEGSSKLCTPWATSSRLGSARSRTCQSASFCSSHLSSLRLAHAPLYSISFSVCMGVVLTFHTNRLFFLGVCRCWLQSDPVVQACGGAGRQACCTAAQGPAESAHGCARRARVGPAPERDRERGLCVGQEREGQGALPHTRIGGVFAGFALRAWRG